MSDPNRTADPAIAVSDLTLAYPPRPGSPPHLAIEGFSVQIARGQVFALLGESGSGKSTLLRYLAGHGAAGGDKPSRIRVASGEASVLNVALRRARRRATTRLTAHVGFLAQSAAASLPPELTIGDILLQPITERSRQFDRTLVGEQIAQMMDLLGLPLQKLQEFPYELSKGQRQKVAVIRSLMLRPALYLADEPTLGVDALGRPSIIELYRWYQQATGAAMLVVTHDIAMLEALVQEVLVLQQGKLVGAGPINEIFRHEDHAYVRQLAQALRSTAYDEMAE